MDPVEHACGAVEKAEPDTGLIANAPIATLQAGPCPETSESALPIDEPRVRQLEFLPPGRPLVERFGAEFFRQLPEQPGVYLMCGARGGVLYVGKARNLRRRLGSYRSANPEKMTRKIRRLLVAVERIYWDECVDENAALERERQLLLALQPRFNTVGVRPPIWRHIGWRNTGGGIELGLGDATAGWVGRRGGFTHTTPFFAAILRLAWRALHPVAAINTIPSRLIGERVSTRWTFSTDPEWAGEFVRRLDEFFTGHSPDLGDWLRAGVHANSVFEENWQKRDRQTCLEFYEHIHGVTL